MKANKARNNKKQGDNTHTHAQTCACTARNKHNNQDKHAADTGSIRRSFPSLQLTLSLLVLYMPLLFSSIFCSFILPLFSSSPLHCVHKRRKGTVTIPCHIPAVDLLHAADQTGSNASWQQDNSKQRGLEWSAV
jgi:hypothetical protein